MNWNKGFSSAYYAMIVDPATWRDISRLEITGGTINKGHTGLRDNATVDCINYNQGIETWVRIYLDATQGGNTEHVPIFTGIATTPEKNFKGAIDESAVECYSVLKPAEDILLDRGWYVPAEIAGGTVIKDLLKVTPAPVSVDSLSPTLQEAIVAEQGESHLSMVDKILTAIDWRMTIDGDGIIHIQPKASNKIAKYDEIENDAIEPEINIQDDYFSCPNVFRAISGELAGIARDDDINSPLSTVNRGREIWQEETSCDFNDGETIAQYARRRLKEEQQVAFTVGYLRRFNPDIRVSDIVTLSYPRQGLAGEYKVISQSIELGHGGRTSEEVIKL